MEDWKRVYANISGEVEEVDIAPALSAACFSIKDTDELVRFLASGTSVSGLIWHRYPYEMRHEHVAV